jgi:hypothetical protein
LEDQLKTNLYGVQMLTEHLAKPDREDIRQHFPCKDESELNPGEEEELKTG